MALCPYCGVPTDPSNSFCTQCGALLPSIPAPPAIPPPPYIPPARRYPLPVVGLIVFVIAALLVAAAIAWVAIGPQGPPFGPAKPAVSLGGAAYAGSNILIAVAYASSNLAASNYRMALQIYGYQSGTVQVPTTSGYSGGTTLSAGGYPFYVFWMDYNNDGALSTGDTFILNSLGGTLPSNSTGSFLLMWSDGSVLSQATFGSPPITIPTAVLGSVSHTSNTSVLVGVTSVSPAYPASYFRIELLVANSSSGSVSMPTYGNGMVNVTVAGHEFLVIWYDLGSNGLVDGGDAFNITSPGVFWPPTGTSMGFFLEWTDGTVLASVYWSA